MTEQEFEDVRNYFAQHIEDELASYERADVAADEVRSLSYEDYCGS